MEIRPTIGGLISWVEPGSVAEAIGLQPGDYLLRVNGHELRDVIDFRFYGADDEIDLDYLRDGQVIHARADSSAGQLGVDFDAPTFDDIHRCNNNCGFCFLKGLPRGMRKSLYIKDDDYRYSFLYGNFVTLTNLTEDDWQRIAEQRLTPLYLSVHATELDVRRRCLGNRKAPDILPQLERLARLRCQVHTQVVLCPRINDGPHLERTIADLVDHYPTVQSIGVVPVGLTHRHRLSDHQRLLLDEPLREFTSEECAGIVDQVETWQSRLRRQHDRTLVYAADELYLRSGRRVPAARFYDGYPQFENGIGMVRALFDDAVRLLRRLRLRPLALVGPRRVHPPLPRSVPPFVGRGPRHGKVALVCGTLIAPTLVSLVEQIQPFVADSLEVLPVVNDYFGDTVTVSGLLTASDMLQALEQRKDFDSVAIARSMLDTPGDRFLDGETLEGFQRVLNRPVIVGSVLSDLFA